MGRKNTKKDSHGLLYVIQKHAATHVHYDLRIEIDGVLVSWALPKKPTNSTFIKRLAVLTTEHPYEYATFEGVIPEGSYGAGVVMVWDLGTYRNIKKGPGSSLAESLKNGLIEIFIEGEKLHGAFALIRMASDTQRWLFIKMKDAYANRDVTLSDRSVVTGRGMLQIKKDNKA